MSEMQFMSDWNLTPAEARALLAMRSGLAITNKVLHQAISKRANTHPDIVKVVICRLRQQIKSRGVEINSTRGGYQLTPASVAIIERAMAFANNQNLCEA